MPTTLKNQFIVSIAGTVLSEVINDKLMEVIVDLSESLPSMFSIEFHDYDLALVDDATFSIGKEVEIKAQEDGGTTSTSIIKGEITSIEPCFTAEGETTLFIRGYDKSHRLHRGKKTRTFLTKKDSDLASTIAGEAGLSTQIDATTVTYDQVIQYNQTNMEFLRSRAERIGYRVFVQDGKLYFVKGDTTAGTGPDLTYLEDLVSFEPRWVSTNQADTMTVKSWDPKGKTAITGSKTPVAGLNQGGMTTTGGATAQSAFSAAEAAVVAIPAFTAGEATELATGVSNDISREAMQAEGVCEGNPLVKPGYTVNIKNVGTRFSGKYHVTSATHVYNPESYRTHFTISGRHPDTLTHLVAPVDDLGASGLIEGVVPALVTNLNDPDNLGRVKVKYAWLGEIESWWVRIATPMAGATRGMQFLPEVNDEVLVAFEHGDIHRPYIVGYLWSNTDKPPMDAATSVASGKVAQRMIKTTSGHTITLADKAGEELVSIKTKSGHQFILDDKSGSEKISIIDKTGSNKMVIDSSNNSMTINVGGDFSVTATGKITLKSTQDLSLEASGGNAKMKGINSTVEGTAKGEVKGPQVSVAGTAQAELKGSAMVTIQGGLVKIN